MTEHVPSGPVEIAPKVWRIPLPLPRFLGAKHLGTVNTYLVGGDRWALIDTGMASDDALEALGASIQVVGIGWRDIDHVLVTHNHADHYGMSEPIRELSQAEVLMHRRDADLAFVKAWVNGQLSDFLVAHGGPAIPDRAPTLSQTGVFRPAAPGSHLEEGQLLDLGGRTLQVLYTPGHSPGHCCLVLDDMVFTGDHLLRKITPHAGFFPGGLDDPLRDFLASMERIAGATYRTCHPAHGEPFGNPAVVARRIICHHESRLKACLDAVRHEANTAWEVVPAVFGRERPALRRFMAVFEVLSYLVYAESSGLAVREQAGGRILWHPTDSAIVSR